MPVCEPLTVHNQFPGYPTSTLPDLTGLKDCSWHNDTCPSWRFGQYLIWIDWPDPRDREDPLGYWFTVVLVDDDENITEGEPALETNNWADVQSYLKGTTQ